MHAQCAKWKGEIVEVKRKKGEKRKKGRNGSKIIPKRSLLRNAKRRLKAKDRSGPYLIRHNYLMRGARATGNENNILKKRGEVQVSKSTSSGEAVPLSAINNNETTNVWGHRKKGSTRKVLNWNMILSIYVS